MQHYPIRIIISPIITYIKIRHACRNTIGKQNFVTAIYHEIRFIIKTQIIMVRNMIYSLPLLYNCAYTLPITDIRINGGDDDNVSTPFLPRHAQLKPC